MTSDADAASGAAPVSAKRDLPLLGISLITLAMALFVVKDSFAKFIVQDVPPAQIIWMQQAGVFILAAVATIWRHGYKALRPSPAGWQLLRGVSCVGGIGALYWSLYYIPLADATAVASVSPALVALLSPLLLGERIGMRRGIAVLIGLAGVVVILKPGFGGRSEGYLIALAAGVGMTLFYIGNRRLAGLHPPIATVAHNGLYGMLVLAPVMPFIWVDPVAQYGLYTAAFLTFSISGQSILVSAFLFAPAFVLAPYQYTYILFAIIAGYVVFSTIPDAAVWTGIFLITASGIYIAFREAALAKGSGSPPVS